MFPFIVKNKNDNKKYLVLQFYQRRFKGTYLLVDLETNLLSVVDDLALRSNYLFVMVKK